MSHWFAKDLSVDEWARVQEAFENIIIRLGAPDSMMLVSERSADGIRERLYACLPHPDIAAVFGGFEPITESDLPLTATLLVGNQTEFAKQFGYSSH